MVWIPIAAWGLAVAVGIVVLGFAAYELRWKAVRLQSDVQRMLALRNTLTELQHDLQSAQDRLGHLRR